LNLSCTPESNANFRIVTEPVATEPVTEVKTEEEEVKPVEETKPTEETKPEPAPKKSNRHSFFARFGKRDEPTEEKKDKEVEPAKDTPATEAETDSKPAETAAETPAPAEKAPSSPRADLLSFLKRDKSPAPKAAIVPEETTEAKPEVKANASTEAAAKDVVAPAEETPAEVPTSSKEVSSPREKRISNFFNFGKDKKAEEKKTEEVKSDSEDADAAPKPSTSPVPKSFLEGLKRKVSKAGKSSDKSETKEVATPAPVEEETPAPVEEETPAPETTAEPVKTEEVKPEEKTAPAIGDVVPEAVTVGAKPVQAAA
jgi:hypothetical protein